MPEIVRISAGLPSDVDQPGRAGAPARAADGDRPPLQWRPRAWIYRPARTATQSGRARTRHWVLEFEPLTPPAPDPLMGWIGSDDTLQQVRLSFPTKESALAFARKQGWSWTVVEPQRPRLLLKSYAQNFLGPPKQPTGS